MASALVDATHLKPLVELVKQFLNRPNYRLSGVNQRAIVTGDISAIPVQGFNGWPSIFSPHAREVALALDYWIQPSIVWQNEVDFELPKSGGTFFTFNGASVPTASTVGATQQDVAVETQFTFGF